MISNSYVSLPEGKHHHPPSNCQVTRAKRRVPPLQRRLHGALAALRQAPAPRRGLAAEAGLARVARQGGAVLLGQRLGGKNVEKSTIFFGA